MPSAMYQVPACVFYMLHEIQLFQYGSEEARDRLLKRWREVSAEFNAHNETRDVHEVIEEVLSATKMQLKSSWEQTLNEVLGEVVV